MNEETLRKLIDRYIEGTLSEEDRSRVEEWYASFEKEEGFTGALNEGERLFLERKIWEQVRAEVKPAGQTRVVRMPWLRKAGKVAAVLAGCLLLTAAVLVYLNRRSEVSVRTAYGEIRSVMLPDSSLVVLNGNSRLRYAGDWDEAETREVWIEGEAFFTVTHKSNNQRFIVNTSDDFKVQVLGTRFNVDNREDAVEVVLNEGSIQLQYAGEETLNLKPDTYVRYEKSTATLERKQVRSEHYSSWVDRREYFDNASLSSVVALLENTYGYTVEVKDPSVLDKKVVGSMPTGSMENFMKALSGAVGLDISVEGRHIIINRPAPSPRTGPIEN